MKTQTKISEVPKKAISILFFLLLFYVLPLALKPQLILNWQVIFLAIICSVLFTTQPRLSIAESKEKKKTDRYTVWLIILVSSIGQITSLIDWAYFPSINKTNNLWELIGAFLLVVGTVFRLYAINILGKYFSSTVQIKKDHKIITAGPYRFLRHPSYTGAYIAMLGSAVFLNSVIGILIFGVGMLFVYRLRIIAEEKTLIQNFKDDYLNYSKHTYKMFPLVW